MGRIRRSELPDGSADQIREELRRLREQLTVEVGAPKLLSTQRFAEEITSRIPSERPTSHTTAWRWLEGRSMPQRSMLEKLRTLSASLKHSVGSFEPSPADDADIKATCLRTQVTVLRDVLQIAPHILEDADEVARAASLFLIALSHYVKITDRDAETALWKMVAAGLLPNEAAQLQPSVGELVGDSLSARQHEILNEWHVHPTGFVVRGALQLVELTAAMRARSIMGAVGG